jgi:ABC-type Fe3+/spermidine/putrescine transport system ATPase subunit
MATADRIAVMNAGRIEQVDAPHAIYTRPRTRFVAAFIGRTNLLEGRLSNDEVGLDGFALKLGQIGGTPADLTKPIMLSMRPQAMALHRGQPAHGMAARCCRPRSRNAPIWASPGITSCARRKAACRCASARRRCRCMK